MHQDVLKTSKERKKTVINLNLYTSSQSLRKYQLCMTHALIDLVIINDNQGSDDSKRGRLYKALSCGKFFLVPTYIYPHRIFGCGNCSAIIALLMRYQGCYRPTTSSTFYHNSHGIYLVFLCSWG